MNTNPNNNNLHILKGSDWMTLPFNLNHDAEPHIQTSEVLIYIIDAMSKSSVFLGYSFESFSTLIKHAREIAANFGDPSVVLMENMASVMATLSDPGIDPYLFSGTAGPVSCGCIHASGLFDLHHKADKPANHWIILGYRLYDSSYCCRLAHLGYGDKALSVEEVERFATGIVNYDLKLSQGEAQPTSLRAHVGTALRRGGGPILHPDFLRPR